MNCCTGFTISWKLRYSYKNVISFLFFSKILVLYDALDTIDTAKVIEFIKGLQQEDGSFYGDKWGRYLFRFTHLFHPIQWVNKQAEIYLNELNLIMKEYNGLTNRQKYLTTCTLHISGEVDTRFSFCAVATLSLLVSCNYYFQNILWMSHSHLMTEYHLRSCVEQ